MTNTALSSTDETYSQREFSFTGKPSRDTRRDGLSRSIRNRSSRRDTITKTFESAGASGLTRIELADLLRIPANHVTAPVLDLIRSGVLIENGERRKGPYGAGGAVLVLSGYLGHDIGDAREPGKVGA